MATLLAETPKVEEDKLLVTNIRGKWKANDFVDYLDLIEKAVTYYDNLNKESDSSSSEDIKKGYDIKNFELKTTDIPVHKIKYSSPGAIELLISAGAITAVVALIKHYIPNAKERAEIRKIEAETYEIEIRNMKNRGISDSRIDNHFKPILLDLYHRLRDFHRIHNDGLINNIEIKELDENDENGFEKDF